MDETTRGFGVAAAVAPAAIRAAAERTEALGYDSFWVNYAGVDGLAALAEAAAVTKRVRLGVGVIPLTGRSPESIVEGVRQLGLPLDRLILGIGSGSAPGGLALVRAGIERLRAELPVEIVIAALGPKMCRLAGEAADGVLFNWVTPEYGRTSADWVREGAAAASRRRPTLYTYVRVALGEAGRRRLAGEGARYGAIPSYASHFARMGVAPETTCIGAASATELPIGLAAWNGIVDEVVVRAITPNDTAEELRELLDAARP
jgi:alkanesulfonate monooxygenase SsuD/methylene tetrahydromethanopterin reductase-like flavin-dependent oxidoreductase (luciferase family)